MKLLWIIFMLQTCHIFGNNENPQSIRDIIKTIFHYKCEMRPRVGEILFWNISTHLKINILAHLLKVFKNRKQFKPQKYIQGITGFQSNESYLIMMRGPDHIQTGKSYIYLYYWVGSVASLDNKKEAAKYTIQLYVLLKKYYELTSAKVFLHIQRERESVETDAFQYNIISHKRNISDLAYRHYQETGILLMYPNLYIMRGVGHTIRMKKVPMSTLWLKNDTCMILETGYTVDKWLPFYIHCGREANMMTYYFRKRIALHFGSNYRMNFMEHLHIIDYNNRSHFKSFIELLEDKNYYRPNDVDNANDHLKNAQTFVNKRDERISLSRIYSDSEAIDKDSSYVILEHGLLKKEITERPLPSYIKGVRYANYILNTDCISGVLVRIGSSIEAGVLTLQHAEAYVHNIESNTSRPTRLHLDGVVFPKLSSS